MLKDPQEPETLRNRHDPETRGEMGELGGDLVAIWARGLNWREAAGI